VEILLLEETDTVSRVALIGMLDTASIRHVEVKFLAATVARGKHAIVDISQMSFIASLGMGMLVGAHKGLRRKGAKLVLLNPQRDVAEALAVARLVDLLLIAFDEAEAQQHLAEADS